MDAARGTRCKVRGTRAIGSGYLEVRREADYPVLTLGFHDDAAVVHRFADAKSTWLLRARSHIATGTAEVPIQDEVTEFTSEFVHGLARAWEVVQRFAVNDGFPDPALWDEM
ncbi:hypothetical protein ACFT5B_00525 [Luteimicrobium sp. NPDC057192]|uniref:hypothetical protein n=1 Tax=Luteimicrobium sp. NPDC057192 TaxID=3346042 RepID=UPI00363AE3B4